MTALAPAVHEYALRMLGDRSMRFGYFATVAHADRELRKFPADRIAGAWRGLNPLRPDFSLAARVDGSLQFQKTRARAPDIARRSALLFDFDAECDSAEMSSDAEHAAAIAQAERCCHWLGSQFSIPRPKMIDSGRGCQLHVPVNLPCDPGTDALVRNLLRSLKSLYPLIDAGMHDRPRLARLPGFWNRKSKSPTPERPWRVARLLHPGDPGIMPREQMAAVIAAIGLPAPVQSSGPEKPDPAKVQRTIQRIAAWLDKVGVALQEIVTLDDGRTLLRLDRCPLFPESHFGSSAGIGVSVSGHPQNFCRHSSCGLRWAEWRAACERKYNVPMQLGGQLIFSKRSN